MPGSHHGHHDGPWHDAEHHDAEHHDAEHHELLLLPQLAASPILNPSDCLRHILRGYPFRFPLN